MKTELIIGELNLKISNFTLMLTAMLLNGFDACMTLYFLAADRSSSWTFKEMNPVMDYFLHQPAWIFWLCKIGGFTILAAFLRWMAETHKAGRVGLWVVTIMYSLVALWHCYLFVTTPL
jgi:xanthine/uracil/vitamin C permease (AzgA family)